MDKVTAIRSEEGVYRRKNMLVLKSVIKIVEDILNGRYDKKREEI